MKIRKDLFLYSLIGISIILILIPSFIFILQNSFTFKDSFLIIGSITGLLTFIIFFWMYMLSNKSIMKFFSNDIVSMINLHRWLGINALVLLLLHPLTLILESLLNRNEILIKIIPVTSYDFRIILGEFTFFIAITVWITSYLARKKIGFRIWKWSHWLTYLILPITYLHADDIGTLFKSAFIKFYIVFMMLAFLSICLYRFLELIGFIGNKYIVKENKKLNKDVLLITLKPKNKEIKPYKGQFVEMKLKSYTESHPFSVFLYNEENGEITLAIKKVGKFTKKLENLTKGEEIYLEGPYGVFTKEAYYPDSRKIILIAGGIGITPFLRFIKYLNKNSSNYDDINLFYANRTLEDITARGYLESLNIPNLKIIFTLNKETKNHNYENGYINTSIILKNIKYKLNDYKIFICGSVSMMDKINSELQTLGIDNHQIYQEEFGW